MPGPQTDPLAFVSLGVSAFSLVTCFCCSLVGGVIGAGFSSIFGIAGAVLGAISVFRIQKEPNRLTGKPLAMAGIAVGGVSVVITVVLLIVVLVFGVAMPAMQQQY
jgi:hypothetical protein